SHRVRESGLDASVGLLPVAHAVEPVIRVSLQIVVLMKGRWFRMAGNGHRLRLDFSQSGIENEVGSPSAANLGEEPPLRAAFAARRVQRAVSSANDGVVAISAAEGRAVGIKHLLFGERGNALERVGIFADIVPGEDSAVGNG